MRGIIMKSENEMYKLILELVKLVHELIMTG